MNLQSHCHQALVNLTAAKMRSFLAILGILVGTAAVVALISCGQMATTKALEQFKNLGTDLLSVVTYQSNPSKSSRDLDSLTLAQWRQLADAVPSIRNIAPYGVAFQPLSFQGKVLQGSLVGADESLADIVHIPMASGNFVSFVTSYEHYCVIGDNIAHQIQELTSENPVGKQVRIGQLLYTIIGVAAPWKENAFFNEDINRAVIIPIAGMALVAQDAKITSAVILLNPDSPIDPTIERIKQWIGFAAPKLSLFPRSAKEIIASMKNQGNIFTLLLTVIGSISLLVGGIGVMNVMLVSVSERKKEIGLRKAVGAKNKEIQALFLMESLILSIVGGLLGIVLGLSVTWIVALCNGWNFFIYPLPLLVGFLVSALTGVFFGFYPAKRAATLEPMACLRSE